MSQTFIIEKQIYGGFGLSKNSEGKKILISYSIEGEEMTVNVVSENKNFSRALPDKILKPSTHRVPPACNVYLKCGGCSYQHIDYEHQLRVKKEIVREIFLTLSKIDLPEIQAIPAQPDYGYRNNVLLKQRAGKLGFTDKQTNRVVEFDNCHITSGNINEFTKFLKTLPIDNINRISIREGAVRELLVSFALNKYATGMKFSAEDVMSYGNKVKCVMINNKIRSGENLLHYDLHGVRYCFSSNTFFQTNINQILNILTIISKELSISEVEKVADLHSGVGTIGLHLAANNGKQVYGIEISADSFKCAKTNAEVNGVTNYLPVCLSSSNGIAWLKSNAIKPDAVILNPPRCGCDKPTLDRLAVLAPERIVYVSCDPSTLARDVVVLMRNNYGINSFYLVDMFPHTFHMESVCFLGKRFGNAAH